MRYYRIIITFFFGVFLITSSCSKKSIDFNCRFITNQKYIQTTTSNNITRVYYSGEKEFIEKMIAKSTENPLIIESSKTFLSSIQSGNKENGVIPITIEYIETNEDNPDGLIQNGDKFYGDYSSNSSLNIDSTSTNRLTTEKRDLLFEVIEQGFKTLVFDGREMEIGDTLEIQTPMSLPLAGETVYMDIVSIYKLIEIRKNVAEFEIKQKVVLNTDASELDFSAMGRGNGRCTYSINDHFFLNNSTKLELKMNFRIDEINSIHIMSTSLLKVESKITAIN